MADPASPPVLETPPMSRLRLAYMAVAMRDPNLVHIEDSVAQESGLPGVIAHGTFAVSYAGSAVSRLVGTDAIRRLSIELTAPVFPGDALAVEMGGSEPEADSPLTGADIRVVKADGTVVGRGRAVWDPSQD